MQTVVNKQHPVSFELRTNIMILQNIKRLQKKIRETNELKNIVALIGRNLICVRDFKPSKIP